MLLFIVFERNTLSVQPRCSHLSDSCQTAVDRFESFFFIVSCFWPESSNQERKKTSKKKGKSMSKSGQTSKKKGALPSFKELERNKKKALKLATITPETAKIELYEALRLSQVPDFYHDFHSDPSCRALTFFASNGIYQKDLLAISGASI